MFNVSKVGVSGLVMVTIASLMNVAAKAETTTVTELSGAATAHLTAVRPGLLEIVAEDPATIQSPAPTEDTMLTYLKCAYANLVAGEFSRALAYVQPVLQNDPSNVKARRYAGVALLETGRARLAADNFQSCIIASGDSPELFDLVKLGDSLRAAGDYKRATEAYAQALKVEPKCAHAYSGLARCYELVGMHATAVRVRERGRQYGCTIENGISEKILNGEYHLPTVRS